MATIAKPYMTAVQALRKQNEEVKRALRSNGGHVEFTARALGVPVERVARLREAAGIEQDRSLWPVIRGEREEERAFVRAFLEDGGSVKRASRVSGVPESTVRRWRDEWGFQPVSAAR